MNSFGKKLIVTTFGESHGEAIGCIIDGIPAGITINIEDIQKDLDRRKPGFSNLVSSRKEDDKAEIISGLINHTTTGAPICILIRNTNQKSQDYEQFKNIFRPGHADFTYFHKYGIRDHRGGGRSSARETAARVAAGSIAKVMLKELDILVESGIYGVHGIQCKEIDFEYSKSSPIFSLSKRMEKKQTKTIIEAKNKLDSVGGVVLTKITGAPIGLGQPLYYKLDGALAEAMVGINAVKAFEIGEGFNSSRIMGSENNDEMSADGFLSNHSGGILGGISNGDDILFKTYFKPTPSIFQSQKTINEDNEEVNLELKGRHDSCVAIRGTVVCESMAALVIADMVLLNMGSQIEHLKKIYQKK